jgi:hypothetical protein
MEIKLKAGTFIKHLNHRDIGYRILNAVWIPEKDGYQIKFEYWNLKGMKRPGPFGLPSQKFFLPKSDMPNWVEVEIK